MTDPVPAPTSRALFIVITDYPGGAEQVAGLLANRLQGRGGWAVEYRVLGHRQIQSFTTARLIPSVAVRYGPTDTPTLGISLLPLTLLGRRYDLVFTTHVYTNALLSLFRGWGMVRAGRLVTRESSTVFDLSAGLRRWLMRALYRLYGNQDLVLVQTKYMGEHISPHVSERTRSRIVAVPNPVDLEAIDASSLQPIEADVAERLGRRINVLVCGRLKPVKRPLVALAAFAEARRRTTSRLQLVFMGDGSERAAIEAAVRTAGLEDAVVLLGQQSNPFRVMRACQYGLLASSREGFPNVVLEMMACGMRKIVMTPCAGDLDTLTGVTVTEDFKAESLADALVQAIEAEEDQSAVYRKTVAGRDVDTYLDRVLGPSSVSGSTHDR